jgi:hypothetical protein
LTAVERTLSIVPTPSGFSLGFWESAVGLLAAAMIGWGLGYLSTPVRGLVDG